MPNFDDRNAHPINGDGDQSRKDEAAIEMLQFEIATWEFNQSRFASQLPNDFLSLKNAARDGFIPEFMLHDAAAHPVLFIAVQHLIKKQLGPIFRGIDADEADPTDLCESAYREYTGAVPSLLRAYVEATPEKREREFGKWLIVPDMRIDETKLLAMFDGGKLSSDDLVEGLSSPHSYKSVLRRGGS